jgi:hypothetical protein
MTSAMPAVSSAQGKLLTKDDLVGLFVGAGVVGGGVGRGVGGVGFSSHFEFLQDNPEQHFLNQLQLLFTFLQPKRESSSVPECDSISTSTNNEVDR